MIKFTTISCNNLNSLNYLFLIPGGPGLSSKTLRSLDPLAEYFNLVYVDFPGTNFNPYIRAKTFDQLSSILIQEMNEYFEKINVSHSSAKKIILGHSYGGFFSADLLIKKFCDGIICLSTPFTNSSLNAAGENYSKHMTKDLQDAANEWDSTPNDRTFAKWLSEYGKLYFTNPKGKDLILSDLVSSQFFLDNRADALGKESMLERLKLIKNAKLFIAGCEDLLLPVQVLQEDASLGGFIFKSVSDASHFTSFDRPLEVCNVIKKYFL